MSDEKIESALAYATRGWAVLPLHWPTDTGCCSCGNGECVSIGKHPLTRRGVKDASKDEATIRQWWARWPQANVAIGTGSDSAVIVLDIDPRHGGNDSLDRLQAEYGKLPRTVSAQSGGGGQHHFFKHPGPDIKVKNKVGIAPGVDLRADGGLIVAPPSLHASGRHYEWAESSGPNERQLAEAPAWLIAIVSNSSRKQDSSSPESNATIDSIERIPKGKRHRALVSAAGAMRARGMTAEEIEAALRVMNTQRCDPPYSDDEVQKIASDIADRYASGSTDGASKRHGGSSASRMAETAVHAGVDLFHSVDGDGFVTAPVGDHRETMRLASKSVQRWLARLLYTTEGKVPSSNALKEALQLLEAMAIFEGVEKAVYVRVASLDDSIYLDLGNSLWEVVEIGVDGWKIIPEAPIKFRRPRGMRALPRPERGGTLDELIPFINVGSEADRVLLLSWIIAALRPSGPFPLLFLHGEPGSAKSTAARVLRSVIDPASVPLRSEPREVRDLMIAASNSWCPAFDNLSYLPQWLSDAFCRLATGGGFSTRELYSDRDEALFDAQLPVLITGIGELATSSDLLDRAIAIYLPAIPEDRRRPEKAFWREFEAARPRILGAVLDAVALAQRRLPSVSTELTALPRMADFAIWAVAAEPAFNCAPGTFLEAYAGNRDAGTQLALEACPVTEPLLELMGEVDHARGWTGTASELLENLASRALDKIKQRRDWPGKPNSLSTTLRRLAPNLRQIGVEVEFWREPDGRRRRMITLRRDAKHDRPKQPSVRAAGGSRETPESRPTGAFKAPVSAISIRNEMPNPDDGAALLEPTHERIEERY